MISNCQMVEKLIVVFTWAQRRKFVGTLKFVSTHLDTSRLIQNCEHNFII